MRETLQNTRESLALNDKVKFDSKGGAILGVLEGPIADYRHPTRNGRTYNERLWDNVFNSEIVREQFENGGILGELDHPKDRDDICTEKVAVIMPEPPTKRNGEYWGRFNILDTPCGRIVYTLAKAGFKLGVSSRGDGDYDEYTGEVDPDSYDFTCFDVVVLPAVKDARMKLVTEGFEKKNGKLKKLLKEQLDRSSENDKKIMKETLYNLKEDKEIPDVELKDDDFNLDLTDKDFPDYDLKDEVESSEESEGEDSGGEDETEEKPEDEENSCETCAEFDAKLGDFLAKFLDSCGLESDSEEDTERFVSMFHETFPALECEECAEEESEEEGEPEDETGGDTTSDELAAADDGAGDKIELLEQLRSTLRENKSLKEELRRTQAEKAEGNTRAEKLTEELSKFKSIAARAGQKAIKEQKTSKRLEELEEKLKNAGDRISELEDCLRETEDNAERTQNSCSEALCERDELREKLKTAEHHSELLESKLSNVQRRASQYRDLAHSVAERYIDSKALSLGVSSNEIKNRLNENYTLDDVDTICEELQDYSVNISKLPFKVDKPGSMRARLREDRSKDPLKDLNSEYDDTVDDYLLDLAGLTDHR